MYMPNIIWLALFATAVAAVDDQARLFSWTTNTEQASQQNHQYQIESNYGEANYNQNDTASFTIDDVIESILASNRQGRNLDGFDEVYSDPTVQDALQKGDDTQARNLIKDKLCTLGLMQCDQADSVDNKNAYLRPSELIYAQPPPGAYRPQYKPQYPPHPPPPSKIIYGAPRPMPPGIINGNKFGPPRKVGYAPSASYNSPPFLNSPPSSGFPGPVYHSKPHGPIIENPPYKFDSHGEHILSNEEFHALGLSETAPVKAAINDGITGAGGNSVNIHHHYHHLDGSQNDNAKAPAIVVNNPIPVPVPVGNGLGLNEFHGQQQFGSTNNFNTLTGGYEHQSLYKPGNGLGSGVNGGYEHQSLYKPGNGLGSGLNGGFGNGPKPVFESSNQFEGTSGFGGTGFGGNAGGFGGNAGSFGGNAGSFGGNAGGFHATNPDFYKKALKAGSNINSLGSYGGLYSGPSSYEPSQQTPRQDNLDCVCVPYDQCPARDVLGRKGDLVLPLDPRNFGSDIEALSNESNSTSTNTTRVAKDASEDNQDDAIVETTKENVKHVTKREVAENKSDVQKADGEARLFGIGNGGAAGIGVGGLGGVGVGITKKKVEPQFGVSFGLPYPSGAYPFNALYGGSPAQNPHFGSISPNGLNLGLVNVNPLLSFQFAKNEYGEKIFKPLVNLHVTPNENIISKVGNLFKAKKHGLFGGGGGGGSDYGAHNQHYHTHTHYAQQPYYEPQHQHNYGTYYDNGPSQISSYPSGYGSDYYDGGYGGIGFRDGGSTGNYADSSITGPSYDYDLNGYYGRSANATRVTASQNYARRYANYDESSGTGAFANANSGTGAFANANSGTGAFASANGGTGAFANANGATANNNQGTQSVSFPTNRRKRSVDTTTDTFDIDNESIAPKSKTIEKRQFGLNQIPQQCGPQQVCCRSPQQVRAPQYSSQGQCGKRNTQGITGRIKNPVYVDGDSEFGEYPWQAAILKKDPKESVYVCGGTLIDAQHIITAAHCVKTYSGYDLRVRLGEWDVNHDVEFFPYIERDVVSVHVHPEYYAGTLDNDLAILRLSVPVDFQNNPHISPACLPDRYADFTNQRCWTTGWGKDAFGDFGKYQNILKEVDVPIIGHQQCEQQLRNTRLGYSYQLNPGFVCAGGEEGKDACKGDGGGPMVCERNGVWNLVGVVSWGIGCGQVNVPGVYGKVAHYLDWINQITKSRF